MIHCRHVLLLLLALWAGPALAADEADTDPQARTLAEFEAYGRQIQELELAVGRYDVTLVEPLMQQARLAMTLNDFSQASGLLDRTVQILRTSEGLYTPAQLPVLQLSIENDVRRGNWPAANDTLEHLYWLYVNKHRGIDAELIEELRALSAFHLEAVAADVEANQAFHFRKAHEISVVTVRAGIYLWGTKDIRLVPLYYDLVKQNYLQAVAVERGSKTGYELREVAPGSTWIRSRQVAMRGLYQGGMSHMRLVRQILASQPEPMPEAVAMADIYIADWQVLFAREDAEQTYRNAYAALQEAGIDAAQIDTMFAAPQVLPVADFHGSVAAAIAARPTADMAADWATGTRDALLFTEWSERFPNVQFPFPRAEYRFLDLEQRGAATLRISLAGMSKVSRWVNGRYVTRLSVPEALQVVSQTPEPVLDEATFEEKLHSLHFRPRLVGGEPTPVEGTLTYLFGGS